MRHLLFALITILICSCSAKKNMLKAEREIELTRTELAENVSVKEYNFQEVDTSMYCITTITERIDLDTVGRPYRIVRSNEVKTKNNKINKSAGATSLQMMRDSSTTVYHDTIYIEKTEDKVVGKTTTETKNNSYWWLLIVIGIICYFILRKGEK